MAQSLSQVFVHFIFSTKNRLPFLSESEIRERVFAYLAEIYNRHRSPAIEVGGVADHIHILCTLGRTIAMSELIGQSKASSSEWMKTLGRGLSKFEWQGGYGAFGVDCSQVERVRQYIRNQAEHHRVKTFQEEYLAILRENNVAYDERFIWS